MPFAPIPPNSPLDPPEIDLFLVQTLKRAGEEERAWSAVVEFIDNSYRVLNETLSHYYVLVDGNVVSLKNRRQIIRSR